MKKLLLSALLMLCVSAFAQKQYTLQSPDGKIIVTIEAGEQLTYPAGLTAVWKITAP